MTPPISHPPSVPEKRLALRPPVGIPSRGESRRTGTLVSVLLHAAVLALIIAPPVFMATTLDFDPKQGAGGAGPAGGGGGGSGGTGGVPLTRERLRFVVLPKATAPTPPAAEVPLPKPVEEKKPEVPKPPPPEPTPTPPPAITPPTVSASATSEVSATVGTGGGSGKDGTAGSGPGSGGGVGSGVGTGRGSGVGPGTGGGSDGTYPPAVVSLPILPLPVPGKVRPYKMVAYFEVDTLGNARLIAFNPSNDGGYNRRIREMLGEIRFRPATRLDGRPVVDTAVVTAEAPRS